MKGIGAMIRAALAAMRSMVWQLVEVGGRMVLALVPSSPAPAMPEVASVEELAAVPDLAAAPCSNDRYERIRDLARQIDVAPADAIERVGVTTAAWLAAMSPLMIAKILFATDQELADHISGRRAIQGVLSYEPEAVADYVRATTVHRPAPSQTTDDELDLALAF